MNKRTTRQEKLELYLSILGFFTCIIIYTLTNIKEKNFFFLQGILLGFYILHQIIRRKKEMKSIRVIKYSKKLISLKNIKKVSY